jgi:hypothetical protein
MLLDIPVEVRYKVLRWALYATVLEIGSPLAKQQIAFDTMMDHNPDRSSY